MKNLLDKMLNRKKVVRVSPEERERKAFEKYAKDQFKRLKDKGLGITVFSL